MYEVVILPKPSNEPSMKQAVNNAVGGGTLISVTIDGNDLIIVFKP